MNRPSWNTYFMNMAIVASSRGTCNRKQVGAVLVGKDNQILATGYNGAISGMPNCDEIGHEIENDHCIRTIHAEVNAMLQAARHGASLKDAICYSTASPCRLCVNLLVQAGIKTFIYNEPYREHESIQFRDKLHAELGVMFKYLPELS